MNQEATLADPQKIVSVDPPPPPPCWIESKQSDFKPITSKVADDDVQKFRAEEGGIGGPIQKLHGRGIIHRADLLLNYLNHDFCRTVRKQNAIPTDHPWKWGVGHFFMASPNNQLEFCVAPILFYVDDSDPENPKTHVLDPFDKNCPYKYTYGVNAAHKPSQDGGDDIYDMGEMWP